MNTDVRVLLADAERALRAEQLAVARAAFLEAGQCAASYQLWRGALRCYRRALELELADREAVGRIVQLPPRVIAIADWHDYARALDLRGWPSFSCRAAQIVTGNVGAQVECPGTGVVMELQMTEDDLVETRPAAAFAGMPLAMAMVILRRALWFAPRELATDPASIRVAFDARPQVAFDARPQVRLDELGDWEPAAPAAQR